MEAIQDFIPYWPLLAMFVLTSIFGQVLKNRILTIEFAVTSKIVYWLRALLPVLLLSLGVVVGAVWPGELIPLVTERVPKIFLMAGCSGASILGFNIVKNWVKTKYKVEIGLQEVRSKK